MKTFWNSEANLFQNNWKCLVLIGTKGPNKLNEGHNDNNKAIYLSAHTQLSPYAQQIQTTIYNEKQYETNITKLIRNIKKISF